MLRLLYVYNECFDRLWCENADFCMLVFHPMYFFPFGSSFPILAGTVNCCFFKIALCTHTNNNKKQVCTDFFSVRSVSFVVLFHSLSHPIFAVINEQRKQKVAPFYRSKTSQNLQIIQSNVIIFRVNFYVACSLNALLNSKMLRFFSRILS